MAASPANCSSRRVARRRVRQPGRIARRRGFTLLELLVAISLMSVLAVLCWRGLDSVLRGRERIRSVSIDTGRLVTAFAQMEEDLRRSWPARRLGLAQYPLVFLPGDNDGPPSMALLRVGVGEDSGRLQRVAYRLRGGVFERGFGFWSPTPTTGESGPVAELVWQPLVDGVEEIGFRGWVQASKSWLSGEALTRLPPPPATLAAGAPYAGVSGVELVIRRHDGLFRRVFAVED